MTEFTNAQEDNEEQRRPRPEPGAMTTDTQWLL
jgi:hypothetical protein